MLFGRPFWTIYVTGQIPTGDQFVKFIFLTVSVRLQSDDSQACKTILQIFLIESKLGYASSLCFKY